jgi:hypothetical protein
MSYHNLMNVFSSLNKMYLVSTTKKSVSVYDLLTLRLLWTVQGKFIDIYKTKQDKTPME